MNAYGINDFQSNFLRKTEICNFSRHSIYYLALSFIEIPNVTHFTENTYNWRYYLSR